MSCPMLNCFLDDETYGKVEKLAAKGLEKNRGLYSVYELLCKINSKDGGDAGADSRPSFSGEKTNGWENTAKVLWENGINDDVICEKIVCEEDIDKAIEFVKETELFSNVSKPSIEAFRKNFLREVAVPIESHPKTEMNNTLL